MNTKKKEAFDKKVRLHVYRHFVDKGHAPDIARVAGDLDETRSRVEAAYRRLAQGRALVLQGNDEILMAEPFSAVPTAFHVEVGDRSWWGNCIWDAMGIPAMLKKDAHIITSCGDCNDAMVVEVKDGKLVETPGIVHYLIPPKHWWDDVVFA